MNMFPVLLEIVEANNNAVIGSFIPTLLTNAAATIKAVGSYAILIIGIALIIISVVFIARGFASHGRENWLVTIGSLLFGGFLTFGGWRTITGNKFGRLGADTLANINAGNTPSTVGTVEKVTESTKTAYDGLNNAIDSVAILDNNFFTPFGQTLAVAVGIILIIIAVWEITEFFIKSGKAQTSWLKVAAMAILGSVLFTATPTSNSAGWTWLRDKGTSAIRDGIENAVEGKSTTQTDGLSTDGFIYNQSDGSLTTNEAVPEGADPSELN